MIHRVHRRARVLAALGVVAVVLGACSSPAPPVQHRYVIPEGTRDLYLTGGAPVIFPDELVAHVGDTLLIVNNDRVGWQVGPYFVGARAKVSQYLASPSELVGSCKMSAAGEFRIRILPRKD